MTPHSFFSWQNWALLFLNLGAEAAVLWLAIARRAFHKMLMLPVFAAFCLAVDVSGTAIAFFVPVDIIAGAFWHSHFYWLFYWGAQFAAAVMVLLLAVQVLVHVLPPWNRLIALIGIAGATALVILYAILLPLSSPGAALNLVAWASSVTVLLLPILWVIKPSAWPKGMGLIVAGLVTSLLMQLVCVIAADARKTIAGLVDYGLSAAALVCMGCFFAALASNKNLFNYRNMQSVVHKP